MPLGQPSARIRQLTSYADGRPGEQEARLEVSSSFEKWSFFIMPALQEAPLANCPKCSGAIVIERDWHGTYGSCIMCGYVHEVLTRPPVDLAAEEAAMPVRQRRRQPSHGKLRL